VDYQFLGGHRADHSTERTDVPPLLGEGVVRCDAYDQKQMSRLIGLTLLVCALALPSAAAGATSLGRGSGVLKAGCPVDPVASDVFCPPYPLWFSLQAKKWPNRVTGVFMTRWLVPKRPGAVFGGRVRCMNAVGNTVVVGGLLTSPAILAGVPFVEYAVDNGASGDLVSDLGLFPEGDPDLLLLPVGFPTICPAPGLAASIYGYLPVLSGGVLVRTTP
jgi:hypothetical protein